MSATARPEPSPLTKEISAILNGMLTRRGQEQQALANAVGVSKSQMSRMLAGKKHWDIDQLALACAFLEADSLAVILDAEQTVKARKADTRSHLRAVDVAGEQQDEVHEDDYEFTADVPMDLPMAAKRGRRKVDEPAAD